jgi:hypothetical protein
MTKHHYILAGAAIATATLVSMAAIGHHTEESISHLLLSYSPTVVSPGQGNLVAAGFYSDGGVALPTNLATDQYGVLQVASAASSGTCTAYTCVNVTCGPTPTALTTIAGQNGNHYSSLAPGNPEVVIGRPDNVDAGSGVMLLGGVADLIIPANTSQTYACETYLSDGGATISNCTCVP